MQIRTYVYGKSATPLREGTVFNEREILIEMIRGELRITEVDVTESE
jgi:hypothetical protein